MNKTKKQIYINILLCIFLISFCTINLLLNKNIYNGVLSNNYNIITSLDDLNRTDRFIYADLTHAKLENYSIKNSQQKVNIYTYNLNNVNVLLLLKDNTLITNKTPLEVIKDNEITIDIKEKFKDNNYYELVLSNIDYNLDRKIYLYKAYALLSLVLISFIAIIINIIKLFILKRKKVYSIQDNLQKSV